MSKNREFNEDDFDSSDEDADSDVEEESSYNSSIDTYYDDPSLEGEYDAALEDPKKGTSADALHDSLGSLGELPPDLESLGDEIQSPYKSISNLSKSMSRRSKSASTSTKEGINLRDIQIQVENPPDLDADHGEGGARATVKKLKKKKKPKKRGDSAGDGEGDLSGEDPEDSEGPDEEQTPKKKGRVRKSLGKVARPVGRVARPVGKGVVRVAKPVGRGARQVAKPVGRGAKKVGGQAKKVGDHAKRASLAAAKPVVRGGKRVAAPVVRGGKRVAAPVVRGGKRVAKPVGKGVQKAYRPVKRASLAAAKPIRRVGGRAAKPIRRVGGMAGRRVRDSTFGQYTGRQLKRIAPEDQTCTPWKVTQYIVAIIIIIAASVGIVVTSGNADKFSAENLRNIVPGIDDSDLAEQDPFAANEEPPHWSNGGSGGLRMTVVNALQDRWQTAFNIAISDWDFGIPDGLRLSTQRENHDFDCKPVDGMVKICSK